MQATTGKIKIEDQKPIQAAGILRYPSQNGLT